MTARACILCSRCYNAILEAGERKIDRWYAQHRLATAYLSDRCETFLNVNNPEDVTALEQRLLKARTAC
jgi:molybdopterin-guanine dinucleotide biosynthesis protein A